MRNLHKILVVPSANVNIAFPVRIIPDNNVADTVFHAVIDNPLRSDAHCMVDSPVAFAQIEILPVRCSLDSLLVFYGLQSCIFLVIQAVVRFDLFSVNDE